MKITFEIKDMDAVTSGINNQKVLIDHAIRNNPDLRSIKKYEIVRVTSDVEKQSLIVTIDACNTNFFQEEK